MQTNSRRVEAADAESSLATLCDKTNGTAKVEGLLPPPCRELYDIEDRLEVAVTEPDDDGVSRLAEAYLAWLDREVAESGLIRQCAASTPRFLPVLFRIRSGLRTRMRIPRIDRALNRILAAVGQIGSQDGWVLDRRGELSPEWRAMLRSLREVRSLAGSARWLDRVQRGKRPDKHRRRDFGLHCESARFASLRTDWTRRATQLAIDFSSPTCRLDLRLLGKPLFLGDWTSRVSLDGRSLATRGEWTSVCWNEDDDGQFLECNLVLSDGVEIDRQAYLSRNCPILFLTDVVRAERAARIEIEWELPSVGATGMSGLPPTRAQQLAGLAVDARLIPLALPADPMAPATGRISFVDGRIVASLAANQSALVLPIAIVWDKTAMPDAACWRPLTITNDQRVVGPNEAVAWRIPHAGRQVVYFRSTLGVRRLAFLGYQSFNECVIGEIDRKGKLDDWVMIDSDPDNPLPY